MQNYFGRIDESSDLNFYVQPRFVAHIDDNAIDYVTTLYRELLPANGAILDLMSSWISHLPPEVEYEKVVGLGLNREELAANKRLNSFVVQSLNANQTLPFDDGEFDAACCCVSVQYLVKPEIVFREIARTLKKGAPLIVTFSNRCFPTKAVFAWNALDDEGHIELVRQYFAASEMFENITIRKHQPRNGDPLFGVIGTRI